MKYEILIQLETDGLEYVSDLQGIVRELVQPITNIVRPYVHAKKVKVTWKRVPPEKKPKR